MLISNIGNIRNPCTGVTVSWYADFSIPRYPLCVCVHTAVAMVSILAVAGVVLWRGASEVAAHGLGDDVHAAVPSATIFLGVPISIFSLGGCTHCTTTAALWGRHTPVLTNRDLATGCHTQIVPVAAEMAPRHEHNIGKVVASGTTFCVVIVCPPCVPRGLGWTLQRNRNHDTCRATLAAVSVAAATPAAVHSHGARWLPTVWRQDPG